MNAAVDGAYEDAEFFDGEVVLMAVPQNVGGGGVADKDDVDSCLILNASAGVVVTGQCSDGFSGLLEGSEICKTYTGTGCIHGVH